MTPLQEYVKNITVKINNHKRLTQKERIIWYMVFRGNGFITCKEFMNMGIARYGDCIFKIKQKGIDIPYPIIKRVRIGKNVFQTRSIYWLPEIVPVVTDKDIERLIGDVEIDWLREI